MKLFLMAAIALGSMDAMAASGKSCSARLAAAAETKEDLVYVLDTNMFYNDPGIVDRLGDKNVIIPRAVIQELDRHKTELSDRGQTSRQVSANLRKLLNGSSGASEITLSGGGSLAISDVSQDFRWPATLDKAKTDDQIVALGLQLQNLNSSRRVVILSGDNNVAILAHSLGLRSDELKTEVDSEVVKEILEGPLTLPLTEDQSKGLNVAEMHSLTLEQAYGLGLPRNVQPHENQFVVLGSPSEAGAPFDLDQALLKVWRYHDAKGLKVFAPVQRREIAGLVLRPRNMEQIMAADLLLDNRLKLVSLAGRAGTGKTLLTLVAGLAQSPILKNKPLFDKIILTRPHEVVGKDIGYLPGDISEKMEPHLGPFKDNLAVFLENLRERKSEISIPKNTAPTYDMSVAGKAVKRELGKGLALSDLLDEKTNTIKSLVDRILQSDFFTFETITYSRGRSWQNTLLIIDEAQNLTLHETRTILTRAGEGTKVVLLGDIDQIDNKLLNHTNNGLIIAASRFRGKYLAGHVTLTQGERSELATMGSQLLRP